MSTTTSTKSSSSAKSYQRIHVTYRDISDLKINPKNPRIHDKQQIKKLSKSIETFDFNIPIAVDQHDQIVAGHARLEAAKLIGMTQVPVICLAHLSPEQVQAFTITDNRLSELSTWDDQLLAQSLKELSDLNLDFCLDTIGFDLPEIEVRIESLDVEHVNADAETVVLPDSNTKPVSALGDLWLLDRHRILCGNALLREDYRTLLGKQKCEIVFIDAPFNLSISKCVTKNGGPNHHAEFEMASGEMTPAEFTQFLSTVCTHLVACSVDGSIHYHCFDWRHIRELLAAAQVYSEFKNLCVWAKHTGGMGSLYRSQHELVFVFKNGTAPHINNVQLGVHGRYRTNLWSYPGVNCSAHGAEEGKLGHLHPTVKPVAMIADALRDCSHRNHSVLDVFLGSGSTLIAAEKTDRHCYGMEISPLYVDTAIRRWQKLTGKQAIHAVLCQSFDEIEAERLTQSESEVSQKMEVTENV